MFVRHTTLYCKYDGVLITKEIGRNCVLSSNGGKITAPPHFNEASFCTFRDSTRLYEMDCFVVCPQHD